VTKKRLGQNSVLVVKDELYCVSIHRFRKILRFRGRLMSLSVCDLRVSSRPLFPQESTYFSSAGYTRRRIFKKVYAKRFVFTPAKILMSQPLFNELIQLVPTFFSCT